MIQFLRRHRTLALLLVLALAVRLLALSRYADQLGFDPDGYRLLGQSLAAGQGYAFPDKNGPGSPTAYRPPLYPCLLAAVARISGDDEQVFRRLTGAVQLLLGLMTVWLTLLLAQELDLGKFGPLAALFVAVDPLLVYGTTQVMTETTATFLAALLLWMTLRARSPSGWFAAGAAFGLACLCRPTFWAFGVCLGLLELVQLILFRATGPRNPDSTSGWQDSARRACWGALGMAAIIAPWALRNMRTMHHLILTTTHGGYTLILGHNPVYTREVLDRGWGAPWEGASFEDWSSELEAEMRHELGVQPLDKTPEFEVARDGWMNRRALAYIFAEPATALRAGISLVFRFWNVTPLQTAARPIGAGLRWTIGVFYSLMFLAMIAGLWKSRRSTLHGWQPLIVLIVSFTAVHFFYWADMRMRAPLVPAISLLAARGIRRLIQSE
jgi:4-amino-4-deoxy-L-arabinose transferase-like glycosyltransferase